MSATFPIFNLGRRDLPWTLLISVLFACCAMLLLEDTARESSLIKHVAIVFSAVTASAFFGIAATKILCGSGNCCSDEDSFEYESINEVQSENADHFAQKGAVMPEIHPSENVSLIQKMDYSTLNLNAGILSPPESRSKGSTFGTLSPVPHLSPRAEREIDCGIEIAKAIEPFQYNGVYHPKGSMRITRVIRDGVSERQGACSVGDVLIAIDGQNVSELEIDQVRRMLKGRAGSTIMLKLCCDASRDAVTRHVVLTPPPCSLSGAMS